jgi:superfamily II DNA or RNA helicase/HKD family nuclease
MILKEGTYEHLITESLERDIAESTAEGLVCAEENIDSAESPEMLTEHLCHIIKNRLADNNLGLAERADITNKIIEFISAGSNESIGVSGCATKGDTSSIGDLIANSDKKLIEVINSEQEAVRTATHQTAIRPISGFRVSNLFTGGQSVLSLSSEIERDIVSADRISLIVSFLKLSGVNLIYDRLKQFCNTPGHTLRIITTTYCGVTEAKAVQRLASLPNTQIKISYQTDIERLHAKAYIFERQSGMSTAYIGSSNLSKSAQSDGLEWNIRVTNVENPHIIKTALATFDRYWDSHNFEDFNEGGIERFYEQRNLAKSKTAKFDSDGKPIINIACKYTILPHQKQILDKLQIERDHGVTRNLIVAATGTGKTVVSAFDFQQFKRTLNRDPRLLFVAHREEILTQSLSTYRSVLADWNFGDLWVGRHRPEHLDRLFISVQTFQSQYDKVFSRLSPDYYDYIVIDEAHHCAADSYRAIIDHFNPQIRLGLTATPERADNVSLLPDFDNKISAEIRLPKALEEGLLTPFQYFCISDPDTDLSDDSLMSGQRYISSKLLEKLCTKHRVELVLRSLSYYLPDETRCRALCFCEDKNHAIYMARSLCEAGLRAQYLTADSPDDQRVKLNKQLADGRINYLCVVDLFNEGIDIPEVDTVLFLRPTDSLTIFLQQLGRGLRLSPGKQALTVLDFVAQLNRKFDYAGRFRSLMLRPDKNLKEQIANGFTVLPYGCSIHLEEKAQQMVLENISAAIYNRRRLINELQSFGYTPTLGNFIEQIGQDIRLIYKGNMCWTRLLREAGKCHYVDDENTRSFERGLGSLLHVNTPDYLKFIERVMDADGDISWVERDEQPFVVMLYYSLFQKTITKLGVKSIAEAMSRLKQYPLFVSEIKQLVQYLFANIQTKTFKIGAGMPRHLEQYGLYTRDEIMALFGYQTAEKDMQSFGVFNVKEYNTELLFVTLNKSDKDFSPSTQYDDYVISEHKFHWQSPNNESHTGNGARFVHHKETGKRFLLFVREEKKDGYGNTLPFYCFGFVDYISSRGDKPMSIEWELQQPIMPQFLKAI